MPTYLNPQGDAELLRQAARGLAHATPSIDRPEDLYDVLGALSATLASITQSMDQIGRFHRQNANVAHHDDGDRAAGAADAREVAARMRRSAAALDAIVDTVRSAHTAAGRIAWDPPSSDLRRSLDARAAQVSPAEPPAQAPGGPARRVLE